MSGVSSESSGRSLRPTRADPPLLSPYLDTAEYTRVSQLVCDKPDESRHDLLHSPGEINDAGSWLTVLDELKLLLLRRPSRPRPNITKPGRVRDRKLGVRKREQRRMRHA